MTESVPPLSAGEKCAAEAVLALARLGSEPVPVLDWWPPRPGVQVDP